MLKSLKVRLALVALALMAAFGVWLQVADLKDAEEARAQPPADAEHDLARLLGGARPVDMAARLGHALLEAFEVPVDVLEHVVLDDELEVVALVLVLDLLPCISCRSWLCRGRSNSNWH